MSLIVSAAFVAAIMMQGAVADDALLIERQAKEARMSLPFAHGRVTVENIVNGRLPGRGASDGGDAPRSDSRSYELYFKGDMRRCDDIELSSIAILNAEQYLWHGIDEHGKNLAADILPRMEGVKRVPDLRVWGIACGPFSVLCNHSLADCLERADRIGSHVEMVKGDEQTELHVVTIDRARGHLKYWIDSVRGWNVVRAEIETAAPDGNGILRDQLICTLEQFGHIWFPRRVVFTRHHNDTALFEDISVLTRVDFETEVPDSVFSLDGMELPVGTLLREPERKSGPDKFWKRESSSPAAVRPLTDRPRPPLLLYIMIANLVAGVAFVLIYLVRTRIASRRRHE